MKAPTSALRAGMMQRRAVLRRLDEELARSSRERTDLSVGLLYLDGLERVSAGPGPEIAAALVGEVVRRVRCVLRPYDAFGRLSFDEFLVVLPTTGVHDVADVLRRLHREVTARPLPGDGWFSRHGEPGRGHGA